jgi:hypothetical protein
VRDFSFSQAIETDPELKQLILEARHALAFETTFGMRAEAAARAALMAFWRDENGRYTMREIGQAATHVRWHSGEFIYRGLTGPRARESLSVFRRWIRHHFWIIPSIALIGLGLFIYLDVLGDFTEPNSATKEIDFDFLDIGIACYIPLAVVLLDIWLRKLEVVDELVEWSRRSARPNNAEATH